MSSLLLLRPAGEALVAVLSFDGGVTDFLFGFLATSAGFSAFSLEALAVALFLGLIAALVRLEVVVDDFISASSSSSVIAAAAGGLHASLVVVNMTGLALLP